MSISYNITTNFGAKDGLPTNDPNKVVKGSEHTVEFAAIKTAFQQAAPVANPTFTGTATSPSFVGPLQGNVTGNVTGALTGNASTASKWANSRKITFTGDSTGTVWIDGSGNVNCALTTTASGYTHPSYATTNINTSGAQVVDVINTTSEGHISSLSKRTMTLADLGYTGATNANNYSHPSHAGDDINLDTAPMTGAKVLSDLDFNITTDTSGHVTDANATFATRNLTLGNLGYTGATNANYYTHPTSSGNKHIPSGGAADQWLKYSANGTAVWAALPEGSSYTHPTYSATNVNTSGATVVDQIQTNSTGHVTFMNTRSLTLGNLGYTGATDANNYTHSVNGTTNINTSGSTVIDQITTSSEGHVTFMNTRTMTLADLGYTGAANANNFTYTHPAYAGDDINIDTGALGGATVISDLDFNVTTDAQGHVTDANATIATRNLTAANLGALKDTTDTFTGTLTVTGSVVASGNVTAYSDARLKSDVGACMGLSAVEAMNGYNYTMNDEICAGVIAQELEEVAPELVIDNVDGFKSVNYMGLTAYLIEAVKDLSAKVKELEAK
jgi:hypothetical protein